MKVVRMVPPHMILLRKFPDLQAIGCHETVRRDVKYIFILIERHVARVAAIRNT